MKALLLLLLPASTLAWPRVLVATLEGAAASSTCASHLLQYAEALREPQDWAFRMFDSSTKVPEGVAFGSETHLGNFDECLAVATPSFRGQHCLVTTAFAASENQSLALPFPITTAICLPSSCSPEDAALVTNALVAALGVDYGWELGHASSSTDPRLCHTNEPRPFSAADWAAACVLVVFVLLLVLSTAYDLTVTDPGRKREILTAFSVYTNWRRLTNTKQPPGSLKALHGVRFLSICWVVMGHRYTIATVLPSINGADFIPPALRDWTRLYILNGTLSVDSFFMLSGLLASYVFYKEVDRKGSFSPALFYAHRYVRLTPAFAMMVMLYATLIIHSRTGPIWDSSFGPLRDNCQHYWWANLLYIKNYFHPLEEVRRHLCPFSQTRVSFWLTVDVSTVCGSELVPAGGHAAALALAAGAGASVEEAASGSLGRRLLLPAQLRRQLRVHVPQGPGGLAAGAAVPIPERRRLEDVHVLHDAHSLQQLAGGHGHGVPPLQAAKEEGASTDDATVGRGAVVDGDGAAAGQPLHDATLRPARLRVQLGEGGPVPQLLQGGLGLGGGHGHLRLLRRIRRSSEYFPVLDRVLTLQSPHLLHLPDPQRSPDHDQLQHKDSFLH